MTEVSTLVAAVEDAGNEATRLVLGDWLEERGQPHRAEYVQACCAAPDDEAAAARAEDLLAEHETGWLGEWTERLLDWEFELGFVHRVRMTVSQFLAHGQALFETEPVERLELVSDVGEPLSAEEVDAVVGHPAFARVRDCAIVPHPRSRPTPLDAWFRALAANPRITRLRRLGPSDEQFGGNREPAFDRPSFSAFCRAGHLASLRELDLLAWSADTSVRPWLVAELAAAAFAATLERLQAVEACIAVDGVREVATNPVFSALRSLDLGGGTRRPRDYSAALFNSSTLTRLSSLAIGASSMPAYASSRLATRVEKLKVRYARHDHEEPERRLAWRTLASRAPRPERLALEACNPGDAVFGELADSGWLSALRVLTIRNDSQFDVFYPEGTAGLRAIFAPAALPALRELTLHDVADPELLSTLRRWRRLPHVRSLQLTDDSHGRLEPSPLGTQCVPTQASVLRGVVVWSHADVEALLAWPALERATRLQLSFCLRGQKIDLALAELAGRLLRDPRLSRLVELTLGFRRIYAGPAMEALADPRVMPALRKVRVYEGMGNGIPLDAVRARFGLRLQQ